MKSELQKIPGVGPSMARRLENIGCPTLQSLKGQDPGELYHRDCLVHGCQVDRCVLYVYRLVVHYAEHGACPPDKGNWWDWKD